MARRKKNSTEPIYYGEGIIRPTKNGTFRAEINFDGARLRETKKTLLLAQGWIDTKVMELRNDVLPLDAQQLREARQAINLLPASVSLVDAARAWLAAAKPPSSDTLKDAVDAFLADKKAAGLRSKSYSELKSQVKRLERSMPGRLISEIAAKDLLAWLDACQLKGVTRDNYRRALMNFFGWCVRADMIPKNPAEGITPPVLDERLPEVFTPDQFLAVLNAARGVRDGYLMPSLAIGAFAGIRPDELARLNWSAVDLERGHIHVGADVAKIRQQRYVALCDTLAAWLKAFPGSGKILPFSSSTVIRDRVGILKAAKLDHWPQDVLRHSFASYHLALHQDATRTAHELGHTRPGTLYRHYRNAVTREAAAAWFALRPQDLDKKDK